MQDATVQSFLVTLVMLAAISGGIRGSCSWQVRCPEFFVGLAKLEAISAVDRPRSSQVRWLEFPTGFGTPGAISAEE